MFIRPPAYRDMLHFGRDINKNKGTINMVGNIK
jgi:hypothetical protein